ncbi:hypothetical protein [Streptomyces sp. PH10-H1]|uniref:hypothetical protein n=1 Tax=Streptomyces sp. PH10-H1 TaxID=3046212 RepID=UPI0024BBA61C|nr:hypothetical protein [Streptomyces sp. PH10-H1]MDJ0341781.1 hypothetical protein [Streptomyces sp. PH10-H1]
MTTASETRTPTADDGLAVAERRIADEYEITANICGDTLDQLDADDLDAADQDDNDEGATELVEQLLAVLRDWWDALDHLHADMADTTVTQSTLSPAAAQYVANAATEYFRALHRVRKAWIDYSFGPGACPSPGMSGSCITFSNFPPVALDGRIAAESEG